MKKVNQLHQSISRLTSFCKRNEIFAIEDLENLKANIDKNVQKLEQLVIYKPRELSVLSLECLNRCIEILNKCKADLLNFSDVVKDLFLRLQIVLIANNINAVNCIVKNQIEQANKIPDIAIAAPSFGGAPSC